MRNFIKFGFVLLCILITLNVFAQKNKKYKLEYKLSNEVVNYVDTLVRFYVLIEDIESINTVFIKTNIAEYKSKKTQHKITSSVKTQKDKRIRYNLGLFNIAANGLLNVTIEVEDIDGTTYLLEKEK
jgi:hypothetical protein